VERTFSYAEVRSVVLQHIRSKPVGEVVLRDGLFHDFIQHGRHPAPADLEAVREVFHELYLEGVIISGGQINSINHPMSWPFYQVTQYGKKLLQNPEYEPHDQDGYIARLRLAIQPLDTDIIRYLEESLTCYRRGTLLASAVMLGCAGEKAALLLIDAFGAAISDSDRKAKYEKDTSFWMISRKYDALWSRLGPIAKTLPDQLGDDLHTILDRVFDLIRTTRNEAGHPTGKVIEREAMHANLLLFPSYCRRVYALIDHFKVNPA
jgi:hypothetical protein